MSLSKTFLRAPLGFPWASALLLLGCVLTTLPLFFSNQLYLVLGAGNEQADNLNIRWWHTIVTTFVHGGGFPGTVAHILINGSLLLILGSLIERALGTGRFFGLVGTCLAVSYVLKVALGRYAHGISNVTWAFVMFAPILIGHALRTKRASAFRDPVFVLVLLEFLIGLLGLANSWHAIPMLIAIPFVLAWRGVLRENLARIDREEAPLRWGNLARTVGIAIPAALCVFTTGFTLAAVLGYLK